MSFEPKEQVLLDPPKNKIFKRSELIKYDGIQNKLIYLAVKGIVFDVTKNEKVYGEGKLYHIFVGKDSSRGLGKSSLRKEDNLYENSYKTEDLNSRELQVLDDWYIFFSKRYNIVGKVIDE